MSGELIAERSSYVAGKWVAGDEALPVLNPADESHVADVSITPSGEIDRAIEEARRSFDEGVWCGVPARERGAVLHSFLDHVEAGRAQLVNTMVAEAGQPRRFAEMTQLDAGVSLAARHHRPLPVHARGGAQSGSRR